MDTFQADPPDNQEFQVAFAGRTAQLQADGLAVQQQAVQAKDQPVLIAFTMERWFGTMEQPDTQITSRTIPVERPFVHPDDTCAG